MQQFCHDKQTRTLNLKDITFGRSEDQMFYRPVQSRNRLFCDGKGNEPFCRFFLFCESDRIGFLKLDDPIIVYCLIFTILAQAATITVLIIVLHYFLEILLTLHFHDVLKLEATVIFLLHPTLRCIGGLQVHDRRPDSMKNTEGSGVAKGARLPLDEAT